MSFLQKLIDAVRAEGEANEFSSSLPRNWWGPEADKQYGVSRAKREKANRLLNEAWAEIKRLEIEALCSVASEQPAPRPFGWYWVKTWEGWGPAEWTKKGWYAFRSVGHPFPDDDGMGEIGPAIPSPDAPTADPVRESITEMLTGIAMDHETPHSVSRQIMAVCSVLEGNPPAPADVPGEPWSTDLSRFWNDPIDRTSTDQSRCPK